MTPHLSTIVGFLPSPSGGQLKLGPLAFNAYGLCIASGMAAAVWISNRRWIARGGSSEDIGRIAYFALPAGVIGARLYHVATDWRSFRGHWFDVVKIWEGGLGIWGGVALGVLVGLWKARTMRLPLTTMLDVVAPAIPTAQAIGRIGNWFNTELFGRPTTLPWALEVPESKRPAGFQQFATFHPTFLYELAWNLTTAAVVVAAGVWLLRRFRPGAAFAVYVLLYTFGRFFIERIRIDHATRLAGLRINEWVAGVVFLGAALALSRLRRRDSRATPSTSHASSVTDNSAGRPDDADGPDEDHVTNALTTDDQTAAYPAQ